MSVDTNGVRESAAWLKARLPTEEEYRADEFIAMADEVDRLRKDVLEGAVDIVTICRRHNDEIQTKWKPLLAAAEDHLSFGGCLSDISLRKAVAAFGEGE